MKTSWPIVLGAIASAIISWKIFIPFILGIAIGSVINDLNRGVSFKKALINLVRF